MAPGGEPPALSASCLSSACRASLMTAASAARLRERRISLTPLESAELQKNGASADRTTQPSELRKLTFRLWGHKGKKRSEVTEATSGEDRAASPPPIPKSGCRNTGHLAAQCPQAQCSIQLRGFGFPGQGYYSLKIPHLKAQKQEENVGCLQILSGAASADKVEDELKQLIDEKWDWRVK
ncbi:hypothetical protein C2845_PM17G14990 [Panicum miliaceum]|uniref:Uncharacterized protein n=1 Tax=Panicum miliaceum TaxID=4540 RepID=A0A3L6PYU1_PANMI|nr:hypothetical protein C2845_PM17G14990 [Panicum miliaceum]